VSQECSVSSLKLGELSKGRLARIVSLEPGSEICARLMEMGLLEGSLVEIVHEAPFGGDLIAVRVRGALIALRRQEANQIWVTYE
jgi:ferrous iron transport protein A